MVAIDACQDSGAAADRRTPSLNFAIPDPHCPALRVTGAVVRLRRAKEDVMVKPIPEGLHSITPNLAVDGAAEAIEFYKRAFGADEVMRAPDPTGKKVWHANLKIGDSCFFVNDVMPEMGTKPTVCSLWVYAPNVDAAFERATKAGAKPAMPPQDMFWGDRMGTVVDKWGNTWNLATHVKDLTPDQMKKAQDAAVAEMAKQKK